MKSLLGLVLLAWIAISPASLSQSVNAAELAPLRLAMGRAIEDRLIAALSIAALTRAGVPAIALEPMSEPVGRAALRQGDADLAWRPVSRADRERDMDALSTLRSSAIDDRFVLAMRRSVAEAFEIESIGDLALLMEDGWRFDLAVDDGFWTRPDGLKPLQSRYGFAFPRDAVRRLPSEAVLPALAEGEVDVAAGGAADIRLADDRFKVLFDDRAFFRARFLTPIAHRGALERQARARSVLDRLAEALDADALRALCEAWLTAGEEPEAAIEAFLDDRPHITRF